MWAMWRKKWNEFHSHNFIKISEEEKEEEGISKKKINKIEIESDDDNIEKDNNKIENVIIILKI